MQEAVYLPLESDISSIKVQLVQLTTLLETGGSTINSYHVELHNGLSWVTVQGGGGSDASEYSVDTELVMSSLTAGNSYKIRNRAHNVHGWGPRSDELIEIVSGISAKPDATVVQIVNLDVMVSWEEPDNNHAEILKYLVTLVHSDGTTFTEETQYCDASATLIRLQRFCLIPHSVLT